MGFCSSKNEVEKKVIHNRGLSYSTKCHKPNIYKVTMSGEKENIIIPIMHNIVQFYQTVPVLIYYAKDGYQYIYTTEKGEIANEFKHLLEATRSSSEPNISIIYASESSYHYYLICPLHTENMNLVGHLCLLGKIERTFTPEERGGIRKISDHIMQILMLEEK